MSYQKIKRVKKEEYTCYFCGRNDFDSYRKLRNHEPTCEINKYDIEHSQFINKDDNPLSFLPVYKDMSSIVEIMGRKEKEVNIPIYDDSITKKHGIDNITKLNEIFLPFKHQQALNKGNTSNPHEEENHNELDICNVDIDIIVGLT